MGSALNKYRDPALDSDSIVKNEGLAGSGASLELRLVLLIVCREATFPVASAVTSGCAAACEGYEYNLLLALAGLGFFRCSTLRDYSELPRWSKWVIFRLMVSTMR